jgi:hypothetical protein
LQPAKEEVEMADKHESESGNKGKHLEIFVNRRRLDEGDGVLPIMTGGQIAGLIEVPADIAVVRLEGENPPKEIGIAEQVKIRSGMHFLVTRKVVEGGHELGAN